MTQTQLASMFLGVPVNLDDIDSQLTDSMRSMLSQIHIIDGQSGEILDHIQSDSVIDDNHRKNLETYLETFDALVIGGKRYDAHLEKRNRVLIFDEDYTIREFVLFEVDKYRDTEGQKTHFYGHASYLELKKASVLYPQTRSSLTASQHAGWSLNNTGWQVGIVEASGTRTLTIENHTNPYEFLKRIADEFDVELRFRIEHDGNRITGRYVDLLERIGEWNGREVEFGRDLDGIRRIEKQDIVTALLGLGPEDENGNRLEVLVEDSDALQRWGRVDVNGNLHHLIETYEIQSERTEMTEAEARQYTRTALNKRINAQVSYEASVIDLENVPGMENKQIRFGDTMRIKDTHFNPPLYLEARVFEMNRSIKTRAKQEIRLGDYVEYTEEQVHDIFNQLRNQIRQKVSMSQVQDYTYSKPIIDSKDSNTLSSAQNHTNTINTQLRDDLRLMSPLPTNITQGDFGIRATASGSGKYAQMDHRGFFVKGGAIQIERPDGALWVEDGLVYQDYAVTGADPHRMDEVMTPGGPYPAFANEIGAGSYWSGYTDHIDGTEVGFSDIRDSNKGYTVNFQRYYFIHSARYFVIRFQPSTRSTGFEIMRDRIYDGSKQAYGRDFDRSEFGTF